MRCDALSKRAGIGALALIFAGCSAQGAGVVPSTSQAPASRTALHGPAAPNYRAAGPFVYVANVGGSSSYDCYSINVYSLGRHSRLVRQVSNGIDDPRALTIDNLGQLYVANGGGSSSSSSSGANGSVTIYAQGRGSPEFTITRGITFPSALALNSKGFLYVANAAVQSSSSSSGNSGSVTIY